MSMIPAKPRVEVILLSRNSADTGLRIFNSISHHNLNITRAAFTRGESTHPYIPAFGAQLFLSAELTTYEKHWMPVLPLQRSCLLFHLSPKTIEGNCESLSMVMQCYFQTSRNASLSVMD